jgi:hypothetical protein
LGSVNANGKKYEKRQKEGLIGDRLGFHLSGHSSIFDEEIIIFQSVNWGKDANVMHHLNNVMNLEQIFIADNNSQDIIINLVSVKFREGIEFDTRCMAATVWLTPLALRDTPHDLPLHLD